MFEHIPPSEGPFMGLHITRDLDRSETQELVRLIHDEDALDVEFQPLRCIAVPQIERRDGRC